MTTPCLYSIVRYAPYAETEEFANIGVVLCAPKNRTLYFKLTNGNDARVSAFFRDDTIFPLAKDAVARELQLAQEHTHSFKTPADFANFFSNLTAKKESIFHFSSTRVVMAQSPEKELHSLYEKFINHSEYSKERREQILTKELRARINSYSELKGAFKEDTLGGELTRFKMPFVAKDNSKILCAIKPLAFTQKEPGKMMEHCDSWVARVTRAANENLLNLANVLFTIDGHVAPSASESKAMSEIRKTFDKYGLAHFKHDDESSIIDFAKHAL